MSSLPYSQEINRITKLIPKELVDFDSPREPGRMPTQASSEFITNREQGDWAEELVLNTFNSSNLPICAVKYGKSEKRVTGEKGFEEFFLEYQTELDTIGKRPDILIFDKSDYMPEWNYNISGYSKSELEIIVPKAKAGVEIRSSSFLYKKYNSSQEQEMAARKSKIFEFKNTLLNEYRVEIETKPEWKEIIESINDDSLALISFRTPSWSSSPRLKEISQLIGKLKKEISSFQKRSHLSITPKVEDIKVVTKWINKYNVPHFYFQVFFDKVFGISFKTILELIANPENEDVKYFLESDVKNQNKTTIKINPEIGFPVATNTEMPKHISELKELNRGRLLFYVTFRGGVSVLNEESILLNLLKS